MGPKTGIPNEKALLMDEEGKAEQQQIPQELKTVAK